MYVSPTMVARQKKKTERKKKRMSTTELALNKRSRVTHALELIDRRYPARCDTHFCVYDGAKSNNARCQGGTRRYAPVPAVFCCCCCCLSIVVVIDRMLVLPSACFFVDSVFSSPPPLTRPSLNAQVYTIMRFKSSRHINLRSS